MPWIRNGINKVIPSVVWQARPQINTTLAAMPKNGIILDIGAGGRQIHPDVLGVDFILLKNTSVVADIHHLPFGSECISGLFCTGVLEHVEDPTVALKEMHRVLKDNALIHIEVPFMQPYHKDPVDYWRWTLDGLRLFVNKNGFEEIRFGSHLGSNSAQNALIIAYWQSWFHNRYVRKGIELVLSWILFPFKYLDRFIPIDTRDMPSAVFIVGRKAS